ncbi:MAG TPA: DUF1801 domain-containing protein [Longimicrobiaceae bacterium]|nr:DUF1801 domain-containing protein [Longimicrobiaceae bacterium]
MAEPTIDDLLQNYSPEVRELTERTYHLVRSVLPDAHEKVHLGWKSIQFGTGPKMRDVVFGVMPLKERVNIVLAGADLEDPMGLLQGTGKAGRHVKINSVDDLENPALFGLLEAAVEAHGLPAAERAAKAGLPVEGYRAYGSKTMNVPVERLFAAWTDDAVRGRWLGEGKLTIRGVTPNRSLRARWEDETPLDVRFTAKGEAKSQVSVDHRQIADEAAAGRLKEVWKESLGRLKAELESAG